MRVRDGDLSGALQEVQKAAEAAEAVVEPGTSWTSESVPANVLDSVRARVHLQEAKLLLLKGDWESAIEAVSMSMSMENDERVRPAHLRVQSLKVLITAAIQLAPSAEELQSIRQVFEGASGAMQDTADAATKAIIYEVSAALARARHDFHETVDALDLAIVNCQRAIVVGDTLKRPKDRGAGDAAQAAQLAMLHSSMSEALHRRASRGDEARAERHRLRALRLGLTQDRQDALDP
jgi:hypothetical protein